MSDAYSYVVRDVRNIFGAHVATTVTLYRGDRRVRRWEFDDLAFGQTRALRRVRKLRDLYGAEPRERISP